MKKSKGFTLIELLIVIAIVAILAGVVLVAVNPAEQMKRARNAERYAEVNVLMNAVSQYLVDNETLPSCVTTTLKCIGTAGVGACVNDGASGADGCDLSGDLAPYYIADIPIDPDSSASTADTGYNIISTGAAGRVTLSAGYAEGVTISVTR